MTVMPLWRQFDPLPILGRDKKQPPGLAEEDTDQDNAKVESLFEQKTTKKGSVSE